MSVHDDMQKIPNGTPVLVLRNGEWVDGVYIGLDWDMLDNLKPYDGHIVLTMDAHDPWLSRYNIYGDRDVRPTIPNHSPLDDYTTEELLAEVGRRCQ
jgi:hypothetical protein